jgi:hypothetical protein
MYPIFALFEITPVGAFCVAGWVVAGLALGKLLFQDDRKLKHLQADCQALSALLSKDGFQILPKLLNDIALLDFVQLASDFKSAVHTFSTPALRDAELAALLKGMVTAKLNDRKSGQGFLDDVVAEAFTLNLKPSATALAGTPDTPPVTAAKAAA